MTRGRRLHRVECENGVPVRLTLEEGARPFHVRMRCRWRTTGKHWEDEGETDYYRVERTDRIGGEFVVRADAAGYWYLDRSLD
ncbi:MAG: hypothetical protein O3A46_07990 [Candidatus Poribacteria bacterium]|nr:hypothetical protein [Candidatus Poribacteria bacterium]